ncbi:Actin-related protein 6 [Blattella germanica]|nr:Actin-related protein 6 [Blattella germanica]
MSCVYVLDNGACTAKVGLSNAEPRVIPNCIMKAKSERRRPFVGDQLEDCRDASGLFYILPFQKKNVWDYIFSKECCPVNFTETPLIVTEPYFNFPSVQEAMTEIFFEEQLHVMDETHVMNQVKEDACFVSQNFTADMEITRKRDKENTIARDYVLPDFTTLRRGYVRPINTTDEHEQQQVLRLNNERFTVPEILFHPSDLGISQMGIPEAISHSISVCPQETHPHLYANILLTGGCALFPGFRERIEADVPRVFPLKLCSFLCSPMTYAWHGGALLSQDPEFPTMTVSREEYEEEGHSLCFERFDI